MGPSAREAFRAGARWAVYRLSEVVSDQEELTLFEGKVSSAARSGDVEVVGERFSFEERSGGYFRAHPEDGDNYKGGGE